MLLSVIMQRDFPIARKYLFVLVVSRLPQICNRNRVPQVALPW
jgi:hypothetical protein